MRVPQSIDTERLTIRRYTEDDMEKLYLFFNNEEITGPTDMPAHQSREETQAFLDMLIQSYNTDEPLFAMAVCRKSDNELIGSCGFATTDVPCAAQMYYALEPQFRGMGYATEAVEKLLEYMIIVLDIERIAVYCSPDNIASVNLARRAGMEYQGTIRKDDRDTEYFLLTRQRYLFEE
ncbi:GNAT family N-acetyltransferase [Methanolobus sp. WCC5]|uniref:GNAT family N-acetyltransferase n=1 Tax=Methanolobus sp. WCC5 TaxID=3125785 RepID=UPI0032535E94